MSWGYAEAEAYIASLEPAGWRPGLDRIRALVLALGMPQHRFASIHVVGTNGKSSVAEMTAAVLEAHGVRAGAYLSPHSERWTERVRIGGEEISPQAFAAAVERVAQSAAAVNRTLDEIEAVTQFEAVTAAAFVALAGAGVEAAVIEAGLGGRLDATNVLPSRATALVSVGLEHTQWLGETEAEIAAEKLDVLGDHSALVLGPVSAEVAGLARVTAAERHARVVSVRDLSPQLELATDAPYQRRNFAVALACAEVILERLDPARVAAVAAGLRLGGRAQRLEAVPPQPPLLLDAAHNPDGAIALAEALPALAEARPVIACLAALGDKDVDGIVAALAPAIEALVATEIPAERLRGAGRPGSVSHSAAAIAEAGWREGMGEVVVVPDPERAVREALYLAGERGGAALACGSHYLLRYATAAHAAARG